ncbi:BTAD domain-containing putative transcriptional regulator [Phytomonospora sp. NPDC050363]|uniref:AfsR/SARP family transcriptional regulator n=1 Tax=Phytomonospora sp. NPDC050363 TaxID=3155642 RepID=UPI003405A712
MAAPVVRVRILGPVELSVDGAAARLGGPRGRALLTALALRPGETVARERLITQVWGPEPPKTAANQLQIAVHRIRAALTAAGLDATAVLRTKAPGYVLAGVATDLTDFRGLVGTGATAAAAGNWPAAREAFAAALAEWRGPACRELASAAVAAQLEEERLAALEQRMVADLAAGDTAPVIADATALLTSQPLRERTWYLLTLAHLLAGDATEAADAHRRAHAVIAESVGLDPGPELAGLDPAADPRPALDAARAWITAPSRPDIPHPMQLPPEPRHFVGRDGELAAIAGALTTAKSPIAIEGLGGVGKTTIAIRAAHNAAPRHPDGCLYTDLRGTDDPRDPHRVLASFLRSLGVADGAIPDDPAEREHLYRSTLAGRRMLVVLDDAAGADQVRPLLPPAGSAALVVSRTRLHGLDAERVPVDVLPQKDAVTLLARLSGLPGAAGRSDLAELAALTGGLPLALGVVGPRLARRPHALARLTALLTDEQRRLDELSAGDRRVRSCVEFAYRRVSPGAAAMLRAVSALPLPEAGLWLAAAMTGATIAEALHQARELADAQLIRPVRAGWGPGTRLGVHDLVGFYAVHVAGTAEASRRALATGYRALLRCAWEADAHLPYFQHLTPALGEPADADPAALDHVRADPAAWLRAEHETLLAAVADTARLGETDTCWRLATVATNHLELHGHTEDLRQMAEHTETLDLGTTARAHVLFSRTKGMRLEGRVAETVSILRRLRRDFLREGEHAHAAAVAADLSIASRQTGTPPRAREAQLRWALARLGHRERDHRERGLRGWVLVMLGNLLAPADAAEDAYTEALAEFRRCGDRVGEANALTMTGVVAYRRGDHDTALALFRRCVDLHAELGDTPGRLFAEQYTVGALVSAGRLGAAATASDTVIEALAAFPYPVLLIGALRVRGVIHLLSGEHDRAEAVLAESARLATAADLPELADKAARVLRDGPVRPDEALEIAL